MSVLLPLLGIGALATGLIRIPDAYNPASPLDLTAKPTFITQLKLWRLDRSPALCEAALRSAKAAYSPSPELQRGNGCNLVNTGRLSALGGVALASTQVSCPLATRLMLYQNNVLQPAALKYFQSPLKRIRHLGSYACRNVNHSKAGRLSRHATANAIDIAGFSLADGKQISILEDWGNSDAKGAFLKEARNGACRLFSATLGPEYNRLHRNHFHLATGYFPMCS